MRIKERNFWNPDINETIKKAKKYYGKYYPKFYLFEIQETYIKAYIADYNNDSKTAIKEFICFIDKNKIGWIENDL